MHARETEETVHFCTQHIMVTKLMSKNSWYMVHGKVCSKATGSSSWCKLALKTIVQHNTHLLSTQCYDSSVYTTDTSQYVIGFEKRVHLEQNLDFWVVTQYERAVSKLPVALRLEFVAASVREIHTFEV